VDNTFSTPLLVQPLKLGADVVVHSATKYLNGHGDVVAGFSAARKEIMDQIRMVRLKDITGAMLGPQEAFLILRGLKTLKVRMDAVCANTQKVVDFLAGSKYVQKVFYPSLENHPDHAVAVREMTRFGGVVSFEMGSFEEAKKVLNHVHLCAGRQPRRLRDAHPASGFHDALHVHERRDRGRRLLGSPDPSGGQSGRHRYIIADLQQAFEAAQN
jgi:L-methionine-alpha-deamino-gamma